MTKMAADRKEGRKEVRAGIEDYSKKTVERKEGRKLWGKKEWSWEGRLQEVKLAGDKNCIKDEKKEKKWEQKRWLDEELKLNRNKRRNGRRTKEWRRTRKDKVVGRNKRYVGIKAGLKQRKKEDED